MPYVTNINFSQIDKIKKLVYLLSTSVPLKPNISKLSVAVEVSRPTLLDENILLDIYGDFKVVNKYTVEIGGKNKSFKQIENIPNSFVVADEIESGFGSKMPLWLFGFLY